MAKYLESSSIADLNQFRQQIFKIRNEAISITGIDVLDTDTLSSLAIHQIVSQYDKDYNINFSRNGEDAKSNNILIEQKASKIKKDHLKAAFMFHAMGNLEYPRYIFVVRRESDLQILRIYDISSSSNVKIIQNHLLTQRVNWLAKGKLDESKMKRDVITVPEQILLALTNTTTKLIDGCTVIQD
jgi:hypothetical protein